MKIALQKKRWKQLIEFCRGLKPEPKDLYNPVILTMTLLFFGDNFRSRNAKNTHDTSFES